MSKGLIGLAKGTKTATISFKSLSKAMSSNVIGLVAVAVVELADALDLFSSQADRVAEKISKIAKISGAAFQTGVREEDLLVSQENKALGRKPRFVKKKERTRTK